VEFFHLLNALGAGAFAFIGEVEHLALKKGAIAIDLYYLESVPAFGEDVEASIVVSSDDFDDFCRAAHVGNSLGMSANDAERAMCVEALANHLLVARFEDVQRERRARKKNDVEREER
jgi:hypothetical protein